MHYAGETSHEGAYLDHDQGHTGHRGDPGLALLLHLVHNCPPKHRI